MPILTPIIVALFSNIFTWLAARLTLRLALGAAVAATAIASIVVLKSALFAIWIGLSYTIPAPVITAISMVMPSNFSTDISLIITIDTIAAAYKYWLETQNLVKDFVT